MALRKHEIEWATEAHAPTPARRPSANLDHAMAAPSPALALQKLLDEHGAIFAEPAVDRWSQRRALAFIVGSAAGLWMAILVAASETARLIA